MRQQCTEKDTRIKSAISCSYFNYRDKCFTFSDWRWQNSATKFADAEIACLTYPRKLHIQVGTNDTVFTLTTAKEEFERLKRDKNFLELDNKRLFKKLTKVEVENDRLKKRDKLLETVELYLQHRIKKISDINDNRYNIAIIELKSLSEALEYEKVKINKVEEDEEEI